MISATIDTKMFVKDLRINFALLKLSKKAISGKEGLLLSYLPPETTMSGVPTFQIGHQNPFLNGHPYFL